MIGAVATVVAACIGAGVTIGLWAIDHRDGGGGGPGPTATQQANARVFVNRTSAPRGSEVTVSGTGFGPGQEVKILIHTREVGSTTAAADGSFTGVRITIPDDLFADRQYDILATGVSPVRFATTPIRVT